MISFYVAVLTLPLADAMTLFFLNPCMTAVAAWAVRCVASYPLFTLAAMLAHGMVGVWTGIGLA